MLVRLFLPKKSKIFDNIIQLSLIAKEAAQILKSIADNWSRLKEGYIMLEKLEGDADDLVHIITDEVEKVFILPLDKEDVKELTDSLDDIIDNMEQIVNRLYIYKILESNQAIKDFSELILQAVQEIHKGIMLVRDRKMGSEEFVSCCEKLHDIENQGDKLHRKILEEMMGRYSPEFGGRDALSIIKWKEIFQTLEDTLDICEDFAITFGRLRIKYA